MRRAAVLMAAFVLAGCTGGSSSLTCESVGAPALAALSRGFTPGFPAIAEGEAVQSRDFDETWFIAAEVGGSGVAVWATDVDPTAEEVTDAQFFSVNGVAQQVSDWPVHPDEELSMDSDGAAEAESCAG